MENVTGSSQADTFTSGTGANSFTGGDGIDTVSYSAASSISASLGAGTASDGDSFSQIENLTGSPGNDTLTGDAGVNLIQGEGGDDTIDVSAAGVDTANCGGGTDSVSAQVADTVAGDCESVVRTDATPPAGGGLAVRRRRRTGGDRPWCRARAHRSGDLEPRGNQDAQRPRRARSPTPSTRQRT